MEENKKINLSFSGNLSYVLSNLEHVIDEAKDLEDKTYLELSKKQIIEYLNYVYKKIKCWQKCYKIKNYELIMSEYKEIESIISQLELCLVEFDNKFHIEIVHHLKNQSFNKLFDMQLYRIKALATSSLSHVGRMEDTLKEHKNIFNAMTSGDVENIYKITMEHMQNPLYINLEDLSSIE